MVRGHGSRFFVHDAGVLPHCKAQQVLVVLRSSSGSHRPLDDGFLAVGNYIPGA